VPGGLRLGDSVLLIVRDSSDPDAHASRVRIVAAHEFNPQQVIDTRMLHNSAFQLTRTSLTLGASQLNARTLDRSRAAQRAPLERRDQ